MAGAEKMLASVCLNAPFGARCFVTVDYLMILGETATMS